MLEYCTIKKSKVFAIAKTSGIKFHSHNIIVFKTSFDKVIESDRSLKNHNNSKKLFRVGYTVSKIVGNATVRNLCKRRLRVAVSEINKLSEARLSKTKSSQVINQNSNSTKTNSGSPLFEPNFDYIFIVKKTNKIPLLADFITDIKFLLRKTANKQNNQIKLLQTNL